MSRAQRLLRSACPLSGVTPTDRSKTSLTVGLVTRRWRGVREHTRDWTGEFIFALLWLVLVLSLGAVTLLSMLIHRARPQGWAPSSWSALRRANRLAAVRLDAEGAGPDRDGADRRALGLREAKR